MMIRHEDNLFLDREANGDVRLLKLKYPPAYPPKSGKPYYEPENVVYDTIIAHNTWCRLITHVSHDKNGPGRWYEAMEFHMGHRG